MIRTSRQSSHAPLYRTVIQDALRTAWVHKQFWPLAFFAAILMTGGTYDVMLRTVSVLTQQGPFMAQNALVQDTA
ncbi:hypothetical protein KBC54_02195, partial [Patescibacteria group bacterium]|nr:hypothetical protein [Patescibacteria group bacterium]